MNITFLIGNGFDLGLGLRTRFSDFYDVYCNSASPNENILRFKDDIRKNISNWSDFEKAFGEHSLNFNKEQATIYFGQFIDFQEKFNDYLHQEELRVSYSDKEYIINTIITALMNFYKTSPAEQIKAEQLLELTKDEEICYNFISFNYTKCLDACLDILKESNALPVGHQVNEVVHVHGYLDENMIMGLNDETQIINEDLQSSFLLLTALEKPSINDYCGTVYAHRAKTLIENSTIICIYGMSLGETDKTWWEEIGEWIERDKKRRLFILHHYPQLDKRFPHQKIQQAESVRDILLKYGYHDGLIYTNTHIGINQPIFAMNLVKEHQHAN